jgi:hypothetical protein
MARRRGASRRQAAALLLLLGAVLAAPGGAARAADAPAHPFAPWIDELEAGAPVRVPGLVLVPLLRPVERQQPRPGARVGLAGVPLEVLDLPEPAGEFYLRVTNRSDQPVEVTAGEALISPAGGARVVRRGAYLPPGESALVATARGQQPRPVGPYVARGLGLSPREQTLLETDRWPAEVERRNRVHGVEARRLADASAAYLTESFETRAQPLSAALARLSGPARVGVVVFDERGASFARIAPDAARFEQHLAFLARELALDALGAQAAGRLPQDGGDDLLRERVRDLLERLRVAPIAAPGFAGAEVSRWDVPQRGGRWHGLAVGGEAWSLTWLMDAPPLPPPTPQPPAQPPRPTDPPPPPPPPPSVNEIDRKARPTPADERLRDRR